MENWVSKTHLSKTERIPILLNKRSISVIPMCDLAGIARQPHPSLSLLQEAHGDGRWMTGAIELPALSIGMSSKLHPLRALKGNFLRLIAGR